jgi:hypothetical protein
MKLSRGFLITLFVILGSTIAFVLLSPMGSGNKKNCLQLKNDLLTLSEVELKDKYKGSLNILTFSDGVVLGLCEDSHTYYFGGNMAVKIDNLIVLTYMGHVCGPRYITMYENQYSALCKHQNIETTKAGFALFLKEKLPNILQ